MEPSSAHNEEVYREKICQVIRLSLVFYRVYGKDSTQKKSQCDQFLMIIDTLHEIFKTNSHLLDSSGSKSSFSHWHFHLCTHLSYLILKKKELNSYPFCTSLYVPLTGLQYRTQSWLWLHMDKHGCRGDAAYGRRRFRCWPVASRRCKLCFPCTRRRAQSINKQEALQTRRGSSLTSTPSALSNFTGFTCRVLQTHSGG